MSLLDDKIRDLINEVHYSDSKTVNTDRKSVEFIMHEVVDFVLAQIVPMQNNEEVKSNIQKLKS